MYAHISFIAQNWSLFSIGRLNWHFWWVWKNLREHVIVDLFGIVLVVTWLFHLLLYFFLDLFMGCFIICVRMTHLLGFYMCVEGRIVFSWLLKDYSAWYWGVNQLLFVALTLFIFFCNGLPPFFLNIWIFHLSTFFHFYHIRLVNCALISVSFSTYARLCA